MHSPNLENEIIKKYSLNMKNLIKSGGKTLTNIQNLSNEKYIYDEVKYVVTSKLTMLIDSFLFDYKPVLLDEAKKYSLILNDYFKKRLRGL